MKVSVIGSGNMGSAFVKQLTAAGHSVAVSSRNAASAEKLAKAHKAKAVALAKAGEADVIILATGAADAAAALKGAGDLNGKVVVDITNPLTADYMGLTLGHSTSSAEEIARAVPGVKLVKAFNTVFAQLLDAGADLGKGGKVSVFVASDDADAKAKVTELAASMGFAVTDAGPLKNARYLEPLAGLNIYLGYGAGRGTAISPAWVQAA
ncbi:MAG: NAD(P)-binding domain-containing protein [Alphaproteobacteria bacterium]|nr:NAD(P)-binding domain-containing protein [Alphaproteobacteria bacterium]